MNLNSEKLLLIEPSSVSPKLVWMFELLTVSEFFKKEQKYKLSNLWQNNIKCKINYPIINNKTSTPEITSCSITNNINIPCIALPHASISMVSKVWISFVSSWIFDHQKLLSCLGQCLIINNIYLSMMIFNMSLAGTT